MSVRWCCPNNLHPAVLGSTKPPRDATVRFCLACSGDSFRLVKREASSLAKKRTVRDSRRKEASRKERVERVERERLATLDAKAEYAVTSPGKESHVFETLRGKDGALAYWKRCERFYGHAELRRVHAGGVDTGVFNGARLLSWERPDGTTYSTKQDR